MLKNKAELFLKLTLFICITIPTIYVIVYFPNYPPILTRFFPKPIIEIKGDEKVNERFLAWFNRDPKRNIPNHPNIIISPADGVVKGIKKIKDTYHIIIEMRYTDVHVQRIPISGKVISITGGGKKLKGEAEVNKYWSKKMLPYQKITVLETEIGNVAIRQITSFFAGRIEVFVKEGDIVSMGQRLGRVLAGSTIVLELPVKVNVLVCPLDEVIAGETIVAKY